MNYLIRMSQNKIYLLYIYITPTLHPNILLKLFSRPANYGGTREPSSQKQFGLAESFCGFEISTKLSNKIFLKFLQKLVVLHRTYQFSQNFRDFLWWNTLTILFLWTHTHHQKNFCTISRIFYLINSLFLRKFFSKNMKFPETLCAICRSAVQLIEIATFYHLSKSSKFYGLEK